MALPLPPGLTPSEVGFLCEMTLVNVIPRQRLDRLDLLGGPTPALQPPFPTALPLWLALLLKRQRRANISPPRWLGVEALSQMLEFETDDRTAAVFSPAPALPTLRGDPSSVVDDDYLGRDALELAPPFSLPTASTTGRSAGGAAASNASDAEALPYHWLELGHLLLTHAADDVPDADAVRRLLRDLREVRGSKLRRGFRVLEAGAGVKMNGVGAMEVAEVRGFVGGMVDGLRSITRSREEARREREAEENGLGGGGGRGGGGGGGGGYGARDDDDDYDMQL